MKMRSICLIVMPFILTACSIFQPVKVESVSTYILKSSSRPTVSEKRTGQSLLVAAPTAAPGYGTNSMAYVDRAYQLKYFTKNRWVDYPSRMLKPLLVQALEDTHHFQAVVMLPYPGDADLRLDTTLLNLYQDFTKQPTQVRLAVRVQLINLTTRQVIATREFDLYANAPEATPYGGVVAANHLTGQLLHQIAAFVVKHSHHLKDV